MEHQDYLNAVDHWLAQNDPAQPAELLTAGVSGPAVASAVLTGSGKDGALAKAKQLKELKNTDEAKAIEAFKNDYADAVSTVLNMARRKAGYNPLDTKDAASAKRFKEYLNRVQEAPFFVLQYARAVRHHNESKNWDALIGAIGDTFEGISDKDKKVVIQSITSLAKVAASSEDTKNTEDLFVQSVLHVGEEYEIFLYSSSVTMESHTSKGSSSSQSLFEVTTVKLRLLKSQWPFTAEKVYRAGHVQAIDDWLDDNTTKPGTLFHNLCIGAGA